MGLGGDSDEIEDESEDKDWEIEMFPRLTLDEHDSFTKFSQNTQLSNPELIALVKAYYDNKD